MPTPPKIKTRKFPGAYVTLEEIEATKPCDLEYAKFLKDFKSNRSPEFESSFWNEYMYQNFPKSRLALTDKIPLSKILRKKSSGGKTGEQRVHWLLVYIPRLRKTYNYFNKKARKFFYERNKDILLGMFPASK